MKFYVVYEKQIRGENEQEDCYGHEYFRSLKNLLAKYPDAREDKDPRWGTEIFADGRFYKEVEFKD